MGESVFFHRQSVSLLSYIKKKKQDNYNFFNNGENKVDVVRASSILYIFHFGGTRTNNAIIYIYDIKRGKDAAPYRKSRRQDLESDCFPNVYAAYIYTPSFSPRVRHTPRYS